MCSPLTALGSFKKEKRQTKQKTFFQQNESIHPPHRRRNGSHRRKIHQTNETREHRARVFRYHHVLNNDGEGITSSIETSDGSVFRKPGEAFILNTAKPHCVVPAKSVRLHAVASVNGPKSTRKDHNNQWLEDTNTTWKDWEREHGYSS